MAAELEVADAETCGDMLAAVSDLCEIWDGYIANNVCPTTCSSDCSNWGGNIAFCGCMVLADGVVFNDAITGPHIHDEVSSASALVHYCFSHRATESAATWLSDRQRTALSVT